MSDLAFPASTATPVAGQPAHKGSHASIPAASWHDAEPESVKLEEDEVHLWVWELRASREVQQRFFTMLSEDERQRHASFRFERDRLAYLIARGTLRRILGSCLSLSPEDVRFLYSRHGKPRIAREAHSTSLPDLEFNLSHTRTHAIAAVSRTIKVGVDLEELRPIDLSVARRVFSATEQQTLNSLPPEQRLKSFYRCWTCKEAISKAEGFGFDMEVASFSVALDPAAAPRILARGHTLSRKWLLDDLPEIGSAIGALAMSRLASRVRSFRVQVSI